MSPFIEVTRESLESRLNEVIAECLTLAEPSAWSVGDNVWIDEVYLGVTLSIMLKPLPRQLSSNELLAILIQHGLIERPQHYVLRYDSKFGGRARWRPLLQLSKHLLTTETLHAAFHWSYHEIEEHPFMTLGIPGDKHAIRPLANPWRLALLLPDPTTLVAHHRPSSNLPVPHAVVATYREDLTAGPDLAAST